MHPNEIKLDHCYSMTPIKGRRTIARVIKLFNISAMAAYEDIKRGATESPHDEPYRGAVCMATRLLPDRMVEKPAAIAAR